MPKYQYSQLTPEMMLNLYLYGQETTPSNLVDDSLIRPFGQVLQIDVDPVSFMSTGLAVSRDWASRPLFGTSSILTIRSLVGRAKGKPFR